MRRPFFPRSQESGFTLPAIIVLSMALLVIGLSALQSTYSVRTSLDDEHFNRLASEAAEAGTVYANYCLSQNEFTQTWGPLKSKPNLTQKTDCFGDDLAYGRDTISTANGVRSRFSVSDLEARIDGAIIINVIGTIERLKADNTTVWQTYTKQLKRSVNWQVYKASKSVSGALRTCSIVNGQLYCWGSNDYGQLGNGTRVLSLEPVKVAQEAGVLANKVVDKVFSAEYFNCALASGNVYCWGRNNRGQIGNNTPVGQSLTDQLVPVQVARSLFGNQDVIDIGGTGETACAITANNKIYCWGDNVKSTAGLGPVAGGLGASRYPRPVVTTALGANYTATALSTSGSLSQTMCAVVNGDAWCWGENYIGQVGNGTTGNIIAYPVQVTKAAGILAGKTVRTITQDGQDNDSSRLYAHVCVLAGTTSTDNKIYCWGENVNGQLGLNNVTDSTTPKLINNGAITGTITDVVAGINHTCALTSVTVYCWGDNSYGQLGKGNYVPSYVPTAIALLPGALAGKTVTAIGGGGNRGCAVASYQSYCWGLNANGQIGDGTQITRLVPTESLFLRPKTPTFIF